MKPLTMQTPILPRLLLGVCGIAVVGLTIYYVAFQARFLIGGPQITLTDVPAIVQSERKVTLSGTASNITAIYLNGRPIVTDESGVWSESIVLQDGYNRIRVDAQDRYGRTTFVEQPFVYSPAEDQPLDN